MPVRYEIDPSRSFVRIEFVGDLTIGEVTQIIQRLIDDAQLRPGMCVMSDHSRGTNVSSPDLVFGYMPRLARLAERVGPFRLALVTPRTAQVGMANFLAAHARHVGVQVAPFRSRAKAEAWLTGGGEEPA